MRQEHRAFYEALGRRVQLSREAKKMTQEKLGAQLLPQLKRAAISNIETGKQGVLAHTLFEIAGHLGVTVSEFFPLDQHKSSPLADSLDMKQSLERADLPRATVELFTKRIGQLQRASEKRSKA